MKRITCFFFLCALSIANTAFAATPVAVKGYRTYVPPQPTETGNKIEVIEFFYYGCPHCFHLEPYINKWLSNAPKDVAFRRIPAVFSDSWIPLAKTFYALDALGELNRLNDAVYDAIHVKHIDLSQEPTLFDWVAQQGIDRKKFADVYNSFSVKNRAEFAKTLTSTYAIEGTPSLVVDGKYLTSPSMTGSYQSVMQVLEQLIDMARQERSSKH
jgi:protein dithiol oxidoreductase (disulfide-forming)